ncbi:MAG: ATP-binding protein, partial [Pseudomonadota bacterium]
FVHIHNVKGESSALDLKEFTDMAHNFEEELSEMRAAPSVRGQDFLSLTVRLDKMISHAQSITDLVGKLSSFNSSSKQIKKNSINNKSWSHLFKLVDDLSKDYGKQVMLVASGLSEVAIPKELERTINSICIQFIKNAVVHGIELPKDRMNLEKYTQGRIDIRLSKTPDGNIELAIRDDGAGFDYDKIRQVAIQSGHWSETELESWDNKKLLSLIFSSGFSTAVSIDKNAGRGAGMDVIMKNIKEHKGKISVSSRSGRYSQFIVSFPTALLQQQAA